MPHHVNLNNPLHLSGTLRSLTRVQSSPLPLVTAFCSMATLAALYDLLPLRPFGGASAAPAVECFDALQELPSHHWQLCTTVDAYSKIKDSEVVTRQFLKCVLAKPDELQEHVQHIVYDDPFVGLANCIGVNCSQAAAPGAFMVNITPLSHHASYNLPLVATSAVIPSTVVHPNVYFPSYLHWVSFSLVFGGAVYVLGAGDARNGSGIATAWSSTYLFLHLHQSLRPPVYPITLAMTAGTAACAALYGTEYFMYQA
ncbi:hypothetical protein F4604DRAFT_1921857 [Suillus subluteus]|nr:hypothetical protein F4604DRAFT_1921857 [Suillus subluteus]